ncbi:MAG: signal peptidase I [Lachnospiraceae bacterium]|nr:signal peptidase I [Lachnospiraceae bacterium]
MKKKKEGQEEEALSKSEDSELELEREETEEQKRKRRVRELFSNAGIFLLVFCFGLFLNRYMIANAQVPTGSMETTVMAGDRILVNRLSYVFGEPKRGDIVTFLYPDDGETLYLKRIMGMPGETIAGSDGVIYIDGKPLEKDFTQKVSYDEFGPYTVPEDSYFMMGDNRNDSWDSRYWEHKFVKREDIIGKAAVSYFPHPRILK